MSALVSMDQSGRITVPKSVRKLLGIEGDANFEVDVDKNSITLSPVAVMPLEDAWAYTSEHRSLLEKAHRDVYEGKFKSLNQDELSKMAIEDDG